MALYCTEEADRHQHLRTGGRIDYQQLVGTNGGARKLTEWMICSERLSQFSLAKSLLYGSQFVELGVSFLFASCIMSYVVIASC